MPSFVIHGMLPLLPLLAIRRLDPRKVWLLWPLTFAPDLDYLFGFHRATTNNIFILLPGFLLAWYGWRHREKRELVEWGLLANAYLVSHLLMDAFMGGIVPLYPFSTWTVCYYAVVDVETATNTPFLRYGDCSRPGIPTVAPMYRWLDYDHTAMLVLLAAFGLAAGAWHLRGRLAARRP